jgi:hypothetical protein
MVQIDNLSGELLQQRWDKLISVIEKEVEVVKAKGNSVIPIVDFSDAVIERNGQFVFKDEVVEKIRRVGSVVVRNVIPKNEARELKVELDSYLENNPKVKEANTNMYHLFWTPSQLKARSHPNMIKLQQALMSVWHCRDSDSQEVSTKFPLAFADRFRIRPPGSQMSLFPHVDGGFIGIGDNKAEFNRIFAKILDDDGDIEEYDPFDFTDRLDALDNVHAAERGKGNAAFRMFQGWLSMSTTGPGGGTLQVNPMLKYTSAYALLRPYFASSPDFKGEPADDDATVPWKFTGRDIFKGQPSRQHMHNTHPHLQLDKTMVSAPEVEPGDYVAWHCDTIHAVEFESHGPGDASVMYIPAVPLTQDNVYYVLEQRKAFENLTTTTIFGRDSEEKTHVGAGSAQDIVGTRALQSMGLGTVPFDVSQATSAGERQIIEKANKLLFV